MCQSFTFDPVVRREDYVYASLSGFDWEGGNKEFNDRVAAFESLARASVPTLDDTKSRRDQSSWRIILTYLAAVNQADHARVFKTPKQACIHHGLHHDLVVFSRAMDGTSTPYMSRDGTQWLDNKGMDSLIGSVLPNDVMDLHSDILTGETRNLLRLLYPTFGSIDHAIQTLSIVLSSMLCEIF
ncbi:hypothetical protein F4802DRAFT_556251 [Xylaria palmicola]|nr:hypothetical protein F4802DRAFT_556251 [Xylaria palmicola]